MLVLIIQVLCVTKTTVKTGDVSSSQVQFPDEDGESGP